MSEAIDARVLDSNEVQFFLDNLAPMETFKVIFLKKDNSQRMLVGTLDPNGKSRKDDVPVMTAEGWKSFNLSRVLFIDCAKESV